MRTTISDLSEAALRGDWSPLIRESEKAQGKHWAENARCSGRDTDMFFPCGDSPQSDPIETVERLGLSLIRPLNLCAACPLTTAARCLVESLRNDEEFGIRGGLIASERSALRASWQKRMDTNAVRRALRGSTAALSKAERNEVIARFAADPEMDAAAVARGLGITHDYLLKLARAHRQKRRTQLAPPLFRSADAA
ncbi:WhiB family transcriptional regulator [Kitasatospora sp. NPDC052868]|uniref:WhiB family transcriptional regulator n=1 Tax=Streptomycetaceae TaxID=2062 RepID=UPI0006AD9EB9|nr:WhiB family transcriptional regulator [Streptomyces sp. XY593]